MVERVERRSHARIIAKGAVSFRSLHRLGQGRLVNVGDGGLFLLTADPVPESLEGAHVSLEIRLDGMHAEWIGVSGTIRRVSLLGIAVVFDEPSPSLLKMIDGISTAARASARILSVVLVDSDVERRSAMAAGFRATGCEVIEAGTSLETIVRLGETSFEPDVIAVADSDSAEAEQMRVFVRREHPTVKLVTIGDELLAPDGIAHWLSSTAPYVDLPGRIREILVRRG